MATDFDLINLRLDGLQKEITRNDVALKELKECSLPRVRCAEIKKTCDAHMEELATKAEVQILKAQLSFLLKLIWTTSGAVLLYLLQGVLKGKITL